MVFFVVVFIQTVASESKFDLYINCRRKIKLHQSVYGLSSWVVDVDEALVCPDFKMEPGIFVHVGGFEHTIDTPLGWQRNRTKRLGIGRSGSIHYLLRCILYETHIIGLQFYSYFLLWSHLTKEKKYIY